MSFSAPIAAPERAVQIQLVADEAERFDAADQHRHQHRNERDGEIVIELADRLDEGPAIGAEHQHAVGGVDQRHAGGEQRRENHDRPDRQALAPLRVAAMPSKPISVAVSKPSPNSKPSGTCASCA